MKAIVRDVYGPPDVLKLEEVDRPTPKDNEVLLRVHAASLNASDWEILRGKPLYGRLWGFFTPKIRILGSDVAGTVEAVGPKVTRFSSGEAVYGDIMGSWGGFAEWVCAPEDMLRHKPESMSFEQASALPQSGTIALQGLLDKGQAQAGQKVLINGAGGGGGTFAIQIAKLVGAEVTAVDNGQKLDLMRTLGADHVIDHTQEDFTRNGQQYELILDLVGHHSLFDFKRSLSPTGRYMVVGGSMSIILGALFMGPLITLFSRKKMGLLAIQVNRGLEVLEEYFQSGAVIPAIERTYPLKNIPEALHCLGEGRAKGKLVITQGVEDGD